MADTERTQGLSSTEATYLAFAFLIAGGLTVAGLMLPALQVDRLWVFTRDISILSGIEGLAGEGQTALAALILALSVIVPLAKIAAGLSIALFFPGLGPASGALVRLFAFLGKWSLADVFVLAIIVMIVDGQLLTSANLGLGIYLFAAGVLIAAAATYRLEASIGQRAPQS